MWNKIRWYETASSEVDEVDGCETRVPNVCVLYFVAIKSPLFATVIDRFGCVFSSSFVFVRWNRVHSTHAHVPFNSILDSNEMVIIVTNEMKIVSNDTDDRPLIVFDLVAFREFWRCHELGSLQPPPNRHHYDLRVRFIRCNLMCIFVHIFDCRKCYVSSRPPPLYIYGVSRSSAHSLHYCQHQAVIPL